MLNFSKAKNGKSKKKSNMSFLGSQTNSAPIKKKKSAPLFAKFTFAAANHGSAASLLENGTDLPDNTSASAQLNAQHEHPEEKATRNSGRHPQWLQHEGETDDDMHSQSGQDGFLSSGTCGEENDEPAEHFFGDLAEEAEATDHQDVDQHVEDTENHEQERNREHPEEDDSKTCVVNNEVEVESRNTGQRILENESQKSLEPETVHESKSPVIPDSLTKRQRKEDIQVADSSTSQQSCNAECNEVSPKKRQRQSEGSALEGSPIRVQPLTDENKASQIIETNESCMIPQTPRKNLSHAKLKDDPVSSDNVHCAATPLPPITSGKTVSRTVGQQENSREKIQTPKGSFGVSKMYANFKLRFGELLDLDAKRDQQNRDIRDQIMAGSDRDSKIVQRWIQEERQKHVAHQRHVEEMLANIKATLARGMNRHSFAIAE